MSDAALSLYTRPCPGQCGRTVSTKGRCASCRALTEQQRGTPTQRGYGRKWTALSASLRRKALLWCGDRMPGAPLTADSQCPQQGIGRAIAALVDHIVPVTGPRDPRFWVRANWQGLCHRCHNAKRRRERRFDGRRNT